MPEPADQMLELVRRVAVLERQVAALEVRPRRLAGEDREAAAILLPIVAVVIGAASFTVSDLMLYATRPEGAAVRAAILQTAGPADHGTGRRIGKLLRRLDGCVVAGFAVERIGRESAGAVWSVRVCEVTKPIPAIATRARAA